MRSGTSTGSRSCTHPSCRWSVVTSRNSLHRSRPKGCRFRSFGRWAAARGLQSAGLLLAVPCRLGSPSRHAFARNSPATRISFAHHG